MSISYSVDSKNFLLWAYPQDKPTQAWMGNILIFNSGFVDRFSAKSESEAWEAAEATLQNISRYPSGISALKWYRWDGKQGDWETQIEHFKRDGHIDPIPDSAEYAPKIL